MKNSLYIFLLFLIANHSFANSLKPRILKVSTREMEINDQSHHMFGPLDHQIFTFPESDTPFLWIKKVELKITSTNPNIKELDKYLCHSRLGLARRNKISENVKIISSPLFAMSQGNMNISFPEGFALKVSNGFDKKFIFGGQLANETNNIPKGKFKLTANIEYFTDSEAIKNGIKPIEMLDTWFVKLPLNSKETIDASEYFRQSKNMKGSRSEEYQHRPGETVWWMVPPGEHTYTSKIGKRGDKKKLRINFARVHMHLYAKSFEIFDLTKNESIWKTITKSNEESISSLQSFNNNSGIIIDGTHEYEIRSIYLNPTKDYIDAMAGIHLYGSVEKKPKLDKKNQIYSPINQFLKE